MGHETTGDTPNDEQTGGQTDSPTRARPVGGAATVVMTMRITHTNRVVVDEARYIIMMGNIGSWRARDTPTTASAVTNRSRHDGPGRPTTTDRLTTAPAVMNASRRERRRDGHAMR
jgi:hypothetical protein